jgi:hypothetical protein
MCTLSWLPGADGFTFWHNRDERITRLPAAPPEVVQRGRLAALTPRDTEAGGTWVGVNELGLALGLANLYPPEGIEAAGPPQSGAVSRGRIVDELLAEGGSAEVARRIGAMDLGVFAPFTLAVVEPETLPELHRWDGHRLESRSVEGAGLLLTSSGAGRRVEELRRTEYERHAPGPLPAAELIEALHRSHLPSLGPDSFCMEREEARTVSLTRVEVRAASIRMIYTPGPPCSTAALAPAASPTLSISLRPVRRRSGPG